MANIRTATLEDSKAIQGLYRTAFPESEAERITLLADDLLREITDPATFTLIAEDNHCIVAAVSFSPVKCNTDSSWQGYILAPLAVSPEHQGQGIGSTLVNTGVEILVGRGINTLFVYGDPAYYGRFGFNAQLAAPYNPPYPLTFPEGWQALSIGEEAIPGELCTLSCVNSLADPALW